MINASVKNKQVKYANGRANGRTKKMSKILQAERRDNDIVSGKRILKGVIYSYYW